MNTLYFPGSSVTLLDALNMQDIYSRQPIELIVVIGMMTGPSSVDVYP
jgi:hypothetical protein